MTDIRKIRWDDDGYMKKYHRPPFSKSLSGGTDMEMENGDILFMIWGYALSACSISAIISSAFSMPTEKRMRSGRTPASISCSSVS